ncbi:MAG: VWA domain-containing protein [Bacteroidales bacterium]
METTLATIFRFGHPEYFWFLLGIPVLIGFYSAYRWLFKRRLRTFGDPAIIRQLMPDFSAQRTAWKFLLIVLAYFFLVLALTDPQYGSKIEKVQREGVELVIALDVSNSMLAEDIQPNRLSRAKRAISKLVDRLANDRIGLLVFAGDAYVQVPVTNDFAATKMFLSSINTDIVPIQGTSIGAAIELGIRSFSPESDLEKAMIIITDGEDHEKNAIKMAQQANEQGIAIHTLGMGSPEGAPIPIRSVNGQPVFQKDDEGKIVVSKLNQTMLQEIAAAGGGEYVLANNTTIGLNTLFDYINQMEKKEMESRIYTDYNHQYQYPLAVVLLLVIIELLIGTRKSKWAKRFNIYKINA